MDTSVSRPELLLVADAVAREKSIERDEVLEAMEQAIQKAGRAKYGSEKDIRATIDRSLSADSRPTRRMSSTTGRIRARPASSPSPAGTKSISRTHRRDVVALVGRNRAVGAGNGGFHHLSQQHRLAPDCRVEGVYRNAGGPGNFGH